MQLQNMNIMNINTSFINLHEVQLIKHPTLCK